MSLSQSLHFSVFSIYYLPKHNIHEGEEKSIVVNIRRKRKKARGEFVETKKNLYLFIKTHQMFLVVCMLASIDDVVLHWFKRLDFWMMCKFVWGLGVWCVRADFFGEMSMSTITSFYHVVTVVNIVSRVFFLSSFPFFYETKKKIYIFQFYTIQRTFSQNCLFSFSMLFCLPRSDGMFYSIFLSLSLLYG